MRDEKLIDEALRNAFWVCDLAPKGLVAIRAISEAMRTAEGGMSVDDLARVGADITQNVDGLAVALGILRGALADLRIVFPEGDDGT